MTKKPFRSRVPCLVPLALALLVAPALAQVPQDVTFTGRLVDGLGAPLVGPVELELRIFDAETGPTQLYSEEHLGVALDVTGGFSVQLGLGTNPSGTFDAALFSDVNRWMEVVVDAEVLTPRQLIGSVPWALVAERANEVVRDPNAPRFEDCGDGTVADHQTGLLWEKKTNDSTWHDVGNGYDWSWGAPYDPDGTAFTGFLAHLNGDPAVVVASIDEARGDPSADPTVCFAHHCDWRLPAIGELRTILIGADAAPGQATTCSAGPCIDPDFAAVGGPTASSNYWSASTVAGFGYRAFLARFAFGTVGDAEKLSSSYVRAVRTGSCD